MSFKELSHGLPHSLAMPRPVSDLDQCSEEGQACPMEMDSWLSGKSKKRKKAKMAQRERWIQRWLPCQRKFPMCMVTVLSPMFQVLCTPTHWLFPGLSNYSSSQNVISARLLYSSHSRAHGSFITSVILLMPSPA